MYLLLTSTRTANIKLQSTNFPRDCQGDPSATLQKKANKIDTCNKHDIEEFACDFEGCQSKFLNRDWFIEA